MYVKTYYIPLIFYTCESKKNGDQHNKVRWKEKSIGRWLLYLLIFALSIIIELEYIENTDIKWSLNKMLTILINKRNVVHTNKATLNLYDI